MAASAWFDCSSGASGDMLMGALLDAGASVETLQRAVDAVVPGAIRLRTERVVRGGLAATKAHVDTEPSPPHRTWHAVRALLARASLPAPVRDTALSVFSRLARAEAAVHGVPVDDVHFHEVGALDAIADVTAVCAAHHELGITEATSTPLVLGHGRVDSAHGSIPVPVPAVLRLAADHGAPVRSGDQPFEMCTPTGAALLLTLCGSWGGLPLLRVRATGTGAGTRDLPRTPNVVRVVLGRSVTAAGGEVEDGEDGGGGEPRLTEAVVVDANIDDLDPRVWPYVLSRLLESGAADAWLTPIVMKKGRPAHTLSVLCPPSRLAALRDVVLTETSTLGLREYPVGKHELARHFATVSLDGHPVRIKFASHRHRLVNRQPEYEDVAAAASALGIPLKTALARASAKAQELAPSASSWSTATPLPPDGEGGGGGS
ncbi:nickel pincer cofactor biosynthesis protein LarC (plasmid) [Streptomyces sp. NBC_01450]|uniref:nickel pincer cofactor biosynthesis protein LarC n=1 Tax=Streptomyces sp. NBC_01450 TaxID=2903871 RepID=UPI002E3089D1|nr:nickel pincer cofactor biosynthesis protein LarC [Streptomyces sp. NBC_01450]